MTERSEHFLVVDAHGRLLPASDEARRVLADRAGRFALLPSAADLLLARRVPAGGGPAERPRCIVAGDLSGFPIADFVAFLHHSRLSGSLTVASGGFERRVAFHEGEVRSARSTAPGERIGEIAVRLGFTDEAQVSRALAAGGEEAKALADLGIVSSNEVWRCLHEQVTAVFHAILLSSSGTFFLLEEDRSERVSTPLSVSTQSLLMDGVRRIDELSLFRGRIAGPRTSLRRREPLRRLTLRPVETALLSLVDGIRTVAEIATAAHLSEFDATKILYHLAEAGYVEPVGEPAAGSAPTERAPAILAGMNALLRAVGSAVPPGARAAFLDGAHAFLADPAGRYAPILAGLSPGPDGGLDEGAVAGSVAGVHSAALARMEPSGDRTRALFDSLREALYFWMFLAGDRLSREEDEALAAQVKRQLARLEGLR